MKVIRIPKEAKTRFQYKTKELISNLNNELEESAFLGDIEVHEYLDALRGISDVGERYKSILKAFASALVE